MSIQEKVDLRMRICASSAFPLMLIQENMESRMRFRAFSLMPIQEKADSRMRFRAFSLMPIQEKADLRLCFHASSAFLLMPLKAKVD